MSPTTPPATLVTTYLEMTERSAFQPAYLPDDPSIMMMRMAVVDLEFYRFLYSGGGAPWRWRDRLLMAEADLHAALSRPETSVDVLYVDGVPAGYVELVRETTGTEVAYFGLRPGFTGRGLGKHLLSWGVEQAWSAGAARVWVHTCNLDAPFALENYIKRGFSVYQVDEEPMPARYL